MLCEKLIKFLKKIPVGKRDVPKYEKYIKS